MDLGITGRIAVVTGGSEGIGLAAAHILAEEGANVVILARTQSKLDAAVAEISSTAVGEIEAISCDVSDQDSVTAAFDRILDKWGKVDILVNNAGTGNANSFDDLTNELLSGDLQLKVFGAVYCSRAALPSMRENKWGRIINITGKSEPDGINGAFCAKAAMHSWAKGMSREVGKHGITVNCIPPGRIISEQILRNYSPEYREWQSENEIPVGEYGQPEDIANLVCYLVSPLARYITGTVIPVDGGLRRYQF